MEMTKKQVLVVMASAVAIALIFVWLFALPVNAKLSDVSVNRITNEVYKNTVVPYYLDQFSQEYIDDVDHFIEDYDPETLASDYREIYIEFDASKYSPVPFQTLWVDVDKIPEKYRDCVVCVTNGPLMRDCEKETSKGNITLIVKKLNYSDEELEAMAKELSYKIKWCLASGIDGFVYL